MKCPQTSMNSSRQLIESQIAKIKASGEVADPNTWISSFIVYKKSGKTYIYYRLMRAEREPNGKLKRKVAKYLGKKGSTEHRRTIEAIARRNKIQALQRRIKQLMKQEKSKIQQGDKRGSPKNAPLTTLERSLLLQLQQQFIHLMARFELLEKKVNERLNFPSR